LKPTPKASPVDANVARITPKTPTGAPPWRRQEQQHCDHNSSDDDLQQPESADGRSEAPVPKRTTFCQDPIKVPNGYGEDWEDWDDVQTRALEEHIALCHGMDWADRGPPPPDDGGPMLWLDMPYNSRLKRWGYDSRGQLPPSYRSWVDAGDWHSEQALKEEHRLAKLNHVPWNLRGPLGPDSGGPRTWRGMLWRPKAQKWMNRGGHQLRDFRTETR
jgi:hypothetical protein